jgi:hypothetical protein
VGWANDFGGSSIGINGNLDELRISDVVLDPMDFLGSDVSPPVPTTCTEVWEMGYGLPIDLNKDCLITFADVKEFVDVWLHCNDPDPAKTNCTSPW